MEVYVLDEQLRRITVIDRYESCIWTERYSAFGDFQLVMHSNPQTRSQLPEGTRLAINNSTRVMTVENVENKDDSEGRSLFTVSGRSLEGTELETRIVRKDLNGTGSDPNWVLLPGPVATKLRDLFNSIMVAGILSPADILPFYQAGSLYPANTIAEPDGVVTLSFPPQTLYKALKETCDAYGLGLRLYRGPDTSKLYFNIYTGDDRTSTQTTLPAVIFDPDLENLSNVSEFRSIELYKNVVLVVGKTRSRWVYADDEAMTATGFDRKVAVFSPSEIELDRYGWTTGMDNAVDAAIVVSTNATHDALLARLKTNTDMTTTEEDSIKIYRTHVTLTEQQRKDLTDAFVEYDRYRTDLAALDDALEQAGKEELSKYRPLQAIDGELPANSKYRYGIDYQLGDIVEMRNQDGLTNRMRVTEQIFVDDAQGERSYPTLALDIFIQPGTWYAWDASGVWDTAIGTWDDQPV